MMDQITQQETQEYFKPVNMPPPPSQIELSADALLLYNQSDALFREKDELLREITDLQRYFATWKTIAVKGWILLASLLVIVPLFLSGILGAFILIIMLVFVFAVLTLLAIKLIGRFSSKLINKAYGIIIAFIGTLGFLVLLSKLNDLGLIILCIAIIWGVYALLQMGGAFFNPDFARIVKRSPNGSAFVGLYRASSCIPPIVTPFLFIGFGMYNSKLNPAADKWLNQQSDQKRGELLQLEGRMQSNLREISEAEIKMERTAVEKTQQAMLQWEAGHITDKEFDGWLESQALKHVTDTIRTLGLEQEIQNPKQLLRVRGYVLPGFKEARRYRKNDICSKRGKDGRWRYSINLYTYFYPAEHQIMVFHYEINAMNWSDFNETTQEYFYNDIIGATTENDQDVVIIDGQERNYRTQRFALQLNNGKSIQASIKSQPIDMDDLPEYDIPDSRIDQTIAQLRLLLRSKKAH